MMDAGTSMEIGFEDSNDENKLEITRNPFDSNLYDKDNFPILDASVFAGSDHKSPGGFSWSIDQMAKIQPADLDMFPNQEYSVIYEKKEDEEQEQKKVDEYFQNVLLPSPWLDNRAELLKRVTFSPHPPDMKYIHPEADDSDGSLNLSDDVERKLSTPKSSNLRDVSCQTSLTLPWNFDLMALLGKQYYTYVDETLPNGCVAKEISATSLRRKLFDQDSGKNTPLKNTKEKVCSVSNTPAYTTSSPSKEKRSSSDSNSSHGKTPTISPLLGGKRANSSDILASPSMFGGANSVGCSPIRQASNVGTPVGKRQDISFSSVDVSPIASCEKQQPAEYSEEESNYSFLPGVSFDLEATEESVFESSRANRFDSPDLSPIGKEVKNSRSIRGIDPMETSENIQQQSIKESTARNFHALGGLELSSIVESASMSKFEDLHEDKGPLDITELQCDEYNALKNDQTKGKSEEDTSPPPLEMTDLLEVTTSVDTENVETPKVIAACIEARTPKIEITPNTPDKSQSSFPLTPLKGILKRRDLPSSSNGSSVEYTKSNTERNSGRTRDKILQSIGKENDLPKPHLTDSIEALSSAEHNEVWKWSWQRSESSSFSDDLVCRKALSALKRSRKLSSYVDDDIFDKENTYSWQCKPGRKYQLNSTAVARSYSGSSSSLSHRLPDFSKLSPDDVSKEEMKTDSGVASMDWASETHGLKCSTSKLPDKIPVTPKNEYKTFSISPLMDLKQLNLTSGNTPLSQRKSGTHHRSRYVYRSNSFINRSLSSQSPLNRSTSPFNRLTIYDRSHSWPSKYISHKSAVSKVSSLVSPPSRYASPASKAFIPRSRAMPLKSTWKPSTDHKCLFKTSEVTSSYKDLLPSPLK